MDISYNEPTIESISPSWLKFYASTIDILRLDSIHPLISGNKYYKLQHHIVDAKEQKKGIISFGGAWSNHIHALAFSGHAYQIPTIGIIRGQNLTYESATLKDAEKWGMNLVYFTRHDYKVFSFNKNFNELYHKLNVDSSDYNVISEGAFDNLGIKGCEMILSDRIMSNQYDEIWLAAGTGATAIGIIKSLNGQSFVRIFSILKSGNSLEEKIRSHTQPSLKNWCVDTNYHFGGYARYNQDLIDCIKSFYVETNIALDPIYTGKLIYALKQKIIAGEISSNKKILIIHTGGLQGVRGIPELQYLIN